MLHGISIIIPTYNRAEFLAPTLKSLMQLRVPDGWAVEILVIDNNCTDTTAEVFDALTARSPFPMRRIVETRQGLCHGRNRGLQEGIFEWLVYLDDDILVNPDWLSGLRECIVRHEADAVVGPVFPLFLQQKPSYLAGRVLDSISSGYSRRGNTMHILDRGVAHELPGCNFAVRKAAANQIGGFNPELDRIADGLLAGGDFEFGQRMVAAGFRTAYHPSCSIQHVMVPEKMTKIYLRKRSYGSGVTVRRMAMARMTMGGKLRLATRACRFGVMSMMHWLRRRQVDAFEFELKMLESIGYLRG